MSAYQDALAQGQLRASLMDGASESAQLISQSIKPEKLLIRSAITALGNEMFIGAVAQRLKVIADEAAKKADEDATLAKKATDEAKLSQAKADAAKAAADKASANAKVAAAQAEKAQSDLQALKAISEKAKREAAAAQTAATQAVSIAKSKQLAAQAAAQLASTAQKKLDSLKSKTGLNKGGQKALPAGSGSSSTTSTENKERPIENSDQVNSSSKIAGTSSLPLVLIAITVVVAAIFLITFAVRSRRRASDSLSALTDLGTAGALARINSEINNSAGVKRARKAAPRKVITPAARTKAASKKKAPVRKVAPKKTAPKKK